MKNPDGLPYRYVPATHDFGKSPVAKQGIVVHVSEGCNPAAYLSSGNVLRNVSANFTVEQGGEIVQMLPVNHTSGSINPRDVRTDTDEDGFWGRRWTRYMDPDILTGRVNQRTISIEVAGRASRAWTCDGETHKRGPNAAQVVSLIELVGVLRDHFKQRLGVNGHRDFTDWKPCPGEGLGIRALLKAVGHGPEMAPPPEPEPDCDELETLVRRLRRERNLARVRVEELEGTLGEQALAISRAVARLKPYLPEPNEP
jgi:hypothetical protein